VSPKRVLVVATAPVDRSELGEHVPADAEVRVVAPASDVSPLQWLASDEDEARAEAAEVAEETGAAVGGEAEVGDPDPVQAIEDALREFPADEVVVVTREGEEAGWLEEGAVAEARERFRVPLTHLALDA
jgi:nucleotide-binding universal stress UspA family protein